MQATPASPVFIRDPAGAIVLTMQNANYEEAAVAYGGEVIESNLPPPLAALLAELETRVSDLSFADIDALQAQIDAFHLTAEWLNHSAFPIKHLYVERSGGVSFRARDATFPPQKNDLS